MSDSNIEEPDQPPARSTGPRCGKADLDVSEDKLTTYDRYYFVRSTVTWSTLCMTAPISSIRFLIDSRSMELPSRITLRLVVRSSTSRREMSTFFTFSTEQSFKARSDMEGSCGFRTSRMRYLISGVNLCNHLH